MTDYIYIHGRNIELTEEQVNQLIDMFDIEPPIPESFKRAPEGDTYFYLDDRGRVFGRMEEGVLSDTDRYAVANYCRIKSVMEQRALQETLNRELWRYSMEHDGDKIDWSDDTQNKYYVYYEHTLHILTVGNRHNLQYLSCVYFYSAEIAESAIEEIVKPFLRAHPEFKF